ncbi:MAG: ATP-dependent Clp protease ATP-binding subunit [Oscillospiraceae bacterium]|jgi:ATP-dependent Clp protease ATP-binding subunit ClpC|nr:ATP-dependent Clp protease ATP-binding subunit [Oscillospiraceae bacterium]
MGRKPFSALAEQVIRRAWALAGALGHSYVGTEHLLLAILRTPGTLSYRLLIWDGVTFEEMMSELVSWKGRGSSALLLPQGFSAAARRAVARAGEDSTPERLQPEHLLLAMLRDESCSAARLLKHSGICLDRLFTNIYEGRNVREEQGMQNTRLLDQFAVDMVQRAEKSQMIIGRQEEIETVLQILSRKHKNNPALIGEPGVGKTAIVEGVAQYILAGRIPEPLRGKRLYSLDMASVIAGTKYRGEFEERVRDILAEIRRAGNIILFVDEMHTLVGAGAAEGAIDAANLLKPALGRGELQMIGATTLGEYRKHIEKDAALERRFRTVQVRQPTEQETLDILVGLRPGLEEHHHIRITDEAVHAAVEMSCRYLPEKFLPDKAVDLLDEGAACAKMQLAGGKTSQAVKELEQDLSRAVQGGEFERAASLRDRLQQLRRRPLSQRSVSVQDIAAAVSSRTGIPVGTVSQSELRQLHVLEQTLCARVVGQDAAISAVSQAVRRGRSGLAEQKRPVAAMLFTGPTGVGKTELCKALAVAVYGSESAMIRIDMSEFMEKHAVSRLIGAPPGYVGHEEGGELSEKVRRRPYSLVLLDELEKAHADVCGLLLQVMEDGILTDSTGRQVDFKNTLIVMTSNLGGSSMSRGSLGFGEREEEPSLACLREHFPPEFLGRIDCIASFLPLGERELARIAENQLLQLQQRAKKVQVSLHFTPQLAASIARRSVGKRSGAREVRRLIQTDVENPLASLLLSNERVPPCVSVSVDGDRVSLIPQRKSLLAP